MMNKWIFFLFCLLPCQLLAYPMDYQISENVETKLATQSCVKDLNLQVTTKDGIVSLVGVTKTNAKAAKVIEITSATVGVRDVDTSQLTTEFGRSPTRDTIVGAKMRGRFLREYGPMECY